MKKKGEYYDGNMVLVFDRTIYLFFKCHNHNKTTKHYLPNIVAFVFINLSNSIETIDTDINEPLKVHG